MIRYFVGLHFFSSIGFTLRILGSPALNWLTILIAVVILSIIIAVSVIRIKKMHYKDIGKLILYDDRVELKTETKVEVIVLNQNKVYANSSEYSDEAPASERDAFSGIFTDIGNTITFTNGSKQSKYHFFLDNQSHAKMMVRRFHEWKKNGIDCAWKVSDNVL